MKRIPLAVATMFTTVSFTAVANPFSVARVPVNGGAAIFELWKDAPIIPECKGINSLALLAKLESPQGTKLYGSGCWTTTADGNIAMLVKSLEDSVVRPLTLPLTKFSKPTVATAQSSTPVATSIVERKKTYSISMADTDVTLEDEPCQNGGKKASFTHKLYDIAGYGCWIDGGQHILVNWTQKKTLSGNIEPFNLHSKIDRPADMPLTTVNNAPKNSAGKVK